MYMASSSSFSIGAKVETHSLTTAEYNSLTGTVTGPVVEKNGVTRVPVKVQLRDGSMKGMMLQPKNLHLSKESPDFKETIEPHFFMAAVFNRDASMIHRLVDRGADVNACDHNERTPMHIAAVCGHVRMVKLLAKLGANVSTRADDGATPVFVAAIEGRVGAIRALVNLGADVNKPADYGSTPVMVAAGGGHVDAIRALVEHGANVNTSDDYGVTPVYMAAQAGHAGAIRKLAEVGANVDTITKNGATPVIIAAQQGHAAAIKVLYKLGADMNPNVRWSVKEVAADQNHIEAVQLIEKILAKMTNECESCGCSSKRLKKCSKCEKVRYCSVECQKQDHKKHKQECLAPSPPEV